MISVQNLRPRSNGNNLLRRSVFLVLSFVGQSAYSQIDYGIRLFEDGNYVEAASFFRDLSQPEARLYEARALFHMGNTQDANDVLSSITQDVSVAFRIELQYTRAVVEYALGQTPSALVRLYGIRNELPEARTLYHDILSYVSPRQRQELKSSIDIADILSALDENASPSGFFAVAPRGTVVSIGVMLPVGERSSPTFGVVQGLYQGILIAVDEFNERSPNLKVQLHFANSDSSAILAFHELRTQHNVKAILGPLRSDEALSIHKLAQTHQIPIFLPLANSFDISESNPFVFRFNPSIKDGGISMAHHAFKDLNLRRIMVMAQPDTDGYDDALAFSQTFGSLGGEIVHFIDRTGYLNFNVVAETLDTLVITREDQPDSLIAEAIYVPFTGPGANAIIDHVMTALEAQRMFVTVLGGEELGFLDHSADRLSRFPIYHTSILDVTPKGERLEVFRTSYSSRTFQNPNDFSYVGYDLATFLFATLSNVQHPDYVAEFAPMMPIFRGLSSQYHLNGSTTNNRVPVYHLTADGPKELTSVNQEP